MRTIIYSSAYLAAIAIVVLLQANQVFSQTIYIPANDFAMQYSPSGTPIGATNQGIYFNGTVPNFGFEFKGFAGAKALTIQSVKSGNRDIGDITFGSTGSLIVNPNRYAFRFSLTPEYGLFFNAVDQQYQFLNGIDAGGGVGTPIFNINANNGHLGINSEPSDNDKVYAYRQIGDFGANKSCLFGYRFGSPNNASNGGSDWSLTGVDAASKGYSHWGNQYTAAVYGSGTLNYEQSSIIMGYQNAQNWGAIGYKDDSLKAWAGYFTGDVKVKDDLEVDHQIRVQRNSTPSSPHIQLQESGSDYARISFKNDVDANRYWAVVGKVESTSTPELAKMNFYYRSGTTGGFDVMSLNGNGRVGIGKSTPTDKLHIYHKASIGLPSSTPMDGLLRVQTEDAFGNITTIFRVRTNKGTAIGANVEPPAEGLYVKGDVAIGTSTPATGYKLSVNGKVMCEELTVQLSSSWPDYVFKDDYELMSIEELKSTIEEHHHLPGIPAAESVENVGISVGEMQTLMMEKIEELTLYIIQQDEQIKELRKSISK